jgi:hypothetical protein
VFRASVRRHRRALRGCVWLYDGWIDLHAAAPSSVLNDCHPRPVNGYYFTKGESTVAGSETCGPKPSLDPLKARVLRIAHDHIWYSIHHGDRLAEVAHRMGISPESALALAISDQVCVEFRLTLK